MPDRPILHLPNKPGRRHTQPQPQRLRGRTLQTRNARILRRDPLCKLCLAKPIPQITPSEVIDHRIPLHLGGTEHDDNLQGICTPCHVVKTTDEASARADAHRTA